jgi:hypothetical protein
MKIRRLLSLQPPPTLQNHRRWGKRKGEAPKQLKMAKEEANLVK